jgi:pyruvate carboxylase subunit B
VDYYINLADQYIEIGAEEICIKDMAGIGRPVSVGKIIKGIRERHPNIIIQYHGHSTPGFSVASSLEAARNGADYIDVGMEPLSWGTGHADLLTIHAMLKDAGFSLPDVNMKAYMEVRKLTQEFIDDFLGLYINPQNRRMNSLLIGPGLPGGMMGSLMADLEKNLKSLNKWLVKNGKEEITQDELLIKLFEEVEHAWPKLGYPPLVTPFSQYVKNASLMNVIQQTKGRDRWSMLDENTWAMILGRSGKLPGPVGEEIIALANNQNREFFNGKPQDLYPDELELFGRKMEEKGWDFGEDDEELLEYAMHPPQYEAFKSGKAKADFLADVEKRRAAQGASTSPAPSSSAPVSTASMPRSLKVEVDGEVFNVKIGYGEDNKANTASNTEKAASNSNGSSNGQYQSITAPLEGKFYLTKESSEKGVQVGDQIKEGETIAYIESMKVINAVAADKSGTVVEILAKHGEDIEEDDIILKVK